MTIRTLSGTSTCINSTFTIHINKHKIYNNSTHAPPIRHLYSWGLEWYPLPGKATPQVEGADKISAYHARFSPSSASGEFVRDLSQLHHTRCK